MERQKGFQKQGMQGDDPEKTSNSYRHVVEALFDLRVLDPAIGSGHFLVEAVDFITDRLLTFLTAFPWNPVTAALRGTRQTILEEMQRQGVNSRWMVVCRGAVALQAGARLQFQGSLELEKFNLTGVRRRLVQHQQVLQAFGGTDQLFGHPWIAPASWIN